MNNKKLVFNRPILLLKVQFAPSPEAVLILKVNCPFLPVLERFLCLDNTNSSLLEKCYLSLVVVLNGGSGGSKFFPILTLLLHTWIRRVINFFVLTLLPRTWIERVKLQFRFFLICMQSRGLKNKK